MKQYTDDHIQKTLTEAIELASNDFSGAKATYIPELENVNGEITNVSIRLVNGHFYEVGNELDTPISLQSTAKVVLLIALLEEYGYNLVRGWSKFEPSGKDFASIARLDQFGPLPSNPMLNAGAISLSAHIKGNTIDEKLKWIQHWAQKLFMQPLRIDQAVFRSEFKTGDRNRSIAYLLRSTGVINCDIEELMTVYFSLCSLEATTAVASTLPLILANQGKNHLGEQVISPETTRIVTSVMTTCGLYNESGTHLVNTGLPAKSGVSGLILASAMGQAGIAVVSPRVNEKGNSIRGSIILEYLSRKLDWHF